MTKRLSGFLIQMKKPSSFLYLALYLATVSLVFLFSFALAGEGKGDGTAVNDGQEILREKWGIEIVRLKLTAAGHILDLRYRVIDPVKSFPVFDSKIKPVLVDEQSGRDLSVYTAPRIGGMRQKSRKPEAGRVYFILFSNPSSLLKEGSKVTLKIQDMKVEHIRVEGEGAPDKL